MLGRFVFEDAFFRGMFPDKVVSIPTSTLLGSPKVCLLFLASGWGIASTETWEDSAQITGHAPMNQPGLTHPG